MAGKSPKRSSSASRRDAAKREVGSTDSTVPKGAGSRPQDGIGWGSAARPARIPTMQDIAAASGVSQSTVSRVLTGAPNAIPINPATRERILEVAREMHYRPNPLARGLRGARTMLLGVIVREITDPFFAAAVDAVSTEANRRGYNVVLGHAHSRTDEAIAVSAVLETRHCDAILLLGDTSDQPRLMEELRDASLPVVGLWWQAPIPGISIIGVDNRYGVDGLMDHLLGFGHRKIAFIGGVFADGPPIGDTGERRTAFLEHAAAHRLETSDEFVRDARNTFGGGAGAFEALMALPERPTAIIASTDVLAIGALHAAYQMRLDVPGEVSIVGFDDLPIAEYATPPLTTVRQPMAEMAAAGVKAAIDEVKNREATSHQILKPTVVVRESSGPAPDGGR